MKQFGSWGFGPSFQLAGLIGCGLGLAGIIFLGWPALAGLGIAAVTSAILTWGITTLDAGAGDFDRAIDQAGASSLEDQIIIGGRPRDDIGDTSTDESLRDAIKIGEDIPEPTRTQQVVKTGTDFVQTTPGRIVTALTIASLGVSAVVSRPNEPTYTPPSSNPDPVSQTSPEEPLRSDRKCRGLADLDARELEETYLNETIEPVPGEAYSFSHDGMQESGWVDKAMKLCFFNVRPGPVTVTFAMEVEPGYTRYTDEIAARFSVHVMDVVTGRFDPIEISIDDGTWRCEDTHGSDESQHIDCEMFYHILTGYQGGPPTVLTWDLLLDKQSDIFIKGGAFQEGTDGRWDSSPWELTVEFE